ncbi:MAG: YbjN domain-containing protein [Pseudomonadota bacterium]
MTVTEHDYAFQPDVHPIDMVETLAEQSAWDFDRLGENQIAMAIEGAWHTYSMTLAWSGRDDMLRLVSTMELTPPEECRSEFYALLNLINDRVWGGAFSHWGAENLLAFRCGLTLAGGAEATPEQIEAMVLNAVGLSERFYPSFQLVCWAGESAEAAFEMGIEAAYGTA